MKVNPIISIVIPAYNEERYISRCLTACINQQTSFPYEIIVVDNNSTDNTIKIAKQFPIIIIQETKKGYGNTARAGVEHARAPLIAITDADTEPGTNWVSAIVQAFQQDNSVVAVGGPFEFYDGSLLLRYFIHLTNKLNPQLLTASLCGMNMAYRKRAYDAVGGYVPNVNLQADTHLGYRLMRYGKVLFLRSNVVKASARRYNNITQAIKELGIRLVNGISLRIRKKPLLYQQTDIR